MAVREVRERRHLTLVTASGGSGVGVRGELPSAGGSVAPTRGLSPGDDFVLTVHGTAAPKGSRTAGRRRDGTIYTRPAAKGEHAFTEAVAMAALQARVAHHVLPPPYSVAIEFFLPRPARPKYSWPTSSGDLDKLVRAALDGLVRGGLLVDDRHVVEISSTKRFDDGEGPRSVVSVRSLPWCSS